MGTQFKNHTHFLVGVVLGVLVAQIAPVRAWMPVIGIVSQPTHQGTEEVKTNAEADGASYIAASYVKWLEAAGARTVPLLYDQFLGAEQPRSSDENILSQLNGVLLAGGGAPIHPTKSAYGRASYRIFEYALREKLPVWGTCLGFEQLLSYSGCVSLGSLKDPIDPDSCLTPLIDVDAENLFLPLSIGNTQDARAPGTAPQTATKKSAALKQEQEARDALKETQELFISTQSPAAVKSISSGSSVSRLGAKTGKRLHHMTETAVSNSTVLDFFSPASLRVVTSENITINMHQKAVGLEQKEKFNSFWHVVASGTDRKSTPFVALAEAKDYPFVATQFHPEKNQYEYFEDYDEDDFQDLGKAIHSFEARRAMAEMAEYFVEKVVKERYADSSSAGGTNRPRMPVDKFRDHLGFFRFASAPVGKADAGHGIMQVYTFGARGGRGVESKQLDSITNLSAVAPEVFA